MKQKQRVPKGEKYWYVIIYCDDVVVDFKTEVWRGEDYARCDLGNYFHTKAEAEQMASKLRAVLKGADVIEMPESNEVDMIQREIGLEVGGEDEELVEAASLGAIKMINWLIDKIIK